jgi:putative restriction endonuclease
MNPLGPTVLIGYEPKLGVFAGFDLRRHGTFAEGSPSVQIDVRRLRQALQDGLAFDRKGNDEIAVAFRADQFINYVHNADDLHKYGKQLATFDLLAKAASSKKVPLPELTGLTADRQRVVQTVSRLSREAGFRLQVLDAYEHRCCVTRMQLRLVDAAHILPVGAPESVDVVRNGLALSPTYHRAFDRALIFLDDSYSMRINPEKEAELKKLQLAAGLPDFKNCLGKIHLPQDKQQWPNADFINRANRFRQIPM